MAIEVNGRGLALLPPLGQLLGCPVRILPVDMRLNHGDTLPSAWCDGLACSIGTRLLAQVRLPPDVLRTHDLAPLPGNETSSGQARGVQVGKDLDGKLGGQAVDEVDAVGGTATQEDLALGSHRVQVVGIVSHGAGDSNANAALPVVVGRVQRQTLVSYGHGRGEGILLPCSHGGSCARTTVPGDDGRVVAQAGSWVGGRQVV